MSVQFGEVFDDLKQDPDWLKTCLVMGLFSLIPIAGQINLLGWCFAICRGRLQGETRLPKASLDYIPDGVPLFLAYLAFIIVAIVFSAFSIAIPALAILFSLAQLAISIAWVFVQPALLYRVYESRSWAAVLDIPALLRIYQSNKDNYVSYVIVFFLAGLLSGLGAVACGIGIFFSIPIGMALLGVGLSFFVEDNAQEGQPLA